MASRVALGQLFVDERLVAHRVALQVYALPSTAAPFDARLRYIDSETNGTMGASSFVSVTKHS